MTSAKTYLQAGLHYGAFYGLAAFLFSLFLYYTLGNPLGPLSWLGVWIPVVFICVAMKNHRDNHLGGYITYWEAFRAGFFTIVFGGALFALLIYLFGNSAAQGLVDDYKNQMMRETEKMRDLHFFSDQMIDKMVEAFDKSTMSSIITDDYVNRMIGGAVVALIAAAVYKKSKPTTDIIN